GRAFFAVNADFRAGKKQLSRGVVAHQARQPAPARNGRLQPDILVFQPLFRDDFREIQFGPFAETGNKARITFRDRLFDFAAQFLFDKISAPGRYVAISDYAAGFFHPFFSVGR
ncbi:MAG TPA: hypothetical protein PKW41_12680, partial [Clostridia bacterium]|nr:hypothetical protein [Clostridia bacterium]HPK16845.1 hypothetical protein [Clostridia bacterium]